MSFLAGHGVANRGNHPVFTIVRFLVHLNLQSCEDVFGRCPILKKTPLLDSWVTLDSRSKMEF
jgi:hypothetical protein